MLGRVHARQFSRSLPGDMSIHIGAEYFVNTGLVALTGRLEKFQHIFVQAEGNLFLVFGRDELPGTFPIDSAGGGDAGEIDFFVGQGAKPFLLGRR